MSKIVHVIAHSHWDREWYLPFEKHRVKLITLIDTLLELFEDDPEFSSFHLDGQTIILEDYLQVRPDRKDKLVELVKTGRLHVGPWYVLQDEFLTSSEANIRNLLIGTRMAKQFGAVCQIGYFPDSFGNMGQAPQILLQAGIDSAVFGRGVKATGFNNSVDDSNHFASPYSEMMWEAPDGSRVLGILFANWYHNGMEIPVEHQAALSYWETRIPRVEKFASTPHLLFMNGCDHQPVQSDLSAALRTARELFPDKEFVHSNFIDYIRRIRDHLPERLAVVSGELRSQRTDGWTTLVNTASARVYIKQANQRVQTLLEKVAEPLAAFAAQWGNPYPHHWFTYAWKTLMQNHPHDSICGCSVDEVHREMMIRFDKSEQVAENLIDESLKKITSRIDTSAFAAFAEDAVPFTVFNTTGWARSGVVSIVLDVFRRVLDRGDIKEAFREAEDYFIGNGVLFDHEGHTVPFTMEDLGAHFTYELPDDAFRRRVIARRVRITFETLGVPALGFRAYAWSGKANGIAAEPAGTLTVAERTMENDHLKVTVEDNGSVTLTDKLTDRTYRDLCVYENVGDIGNEYMFKQTDDPEALTTKHVPAKIRLVEHSAERAVFEVVHEWELPASAEEGHLEDMRRLVNYRKDRKSKRAKEKVPFVISTLFTLERNGRGLKVRSSFNNQVKDHRLRALMPTDLQAETHFADSIFEVSERPSTPSPEWTNPSYCHHQQAFVDVSSAEGGLTVSNLGLNEYEILRDGRNTIAVTLLRSVGELGDWGYFPTPEAQCLGEHTVEFAIFSHYGNGIQSGAYAEAFQFQVPWSVYPTDIHAGELQGEHSFLKWSGPSLALSTVKVSEDSGDFIARWFNMSAQTEQLMVYPTEKVGQIYRSSVMEERGEANPHRAEQPLDVEITPYQIVTLAIEMK